MATASASIYIDFNIGPGRPNGVDNHIWVTQNPTQPPTHPSGLPTLPWIPTQFKQFILGLPWPNVSPEEHDLDWLDSDKDLMCNLDGIWNALHTLQFMKKCAEEYFDTNVARANLWLANIGLALQDPRECHLGLYPIIMDMSVSDSSKPCLP